MDNRMWIIVVGMMLTTWPHSVQAVSDLPPFIEHKPDIKPVADDPLPAGAIARFGSKRAMHSVQSNIAFSPDGKRFAAAGHDNAVQLRHAADGSLIAKFRAYRTCYAVAFAPDGKTIALGDQNTIRILNVDDGEEVGRLEKHEGIIFTLQFFSDGKRLISASDDRYLILWDVNSGKVLHRTLMAEVEPITTLRLARDGKYALLGDRSGRLLHWDIGAWRSRLETPIQYSHAECVFFHPDGRTAGIACRSKPIQLYDLKGEKPARSLPHTGGIAAVSHDGLLLATAEDYRQLDGSIHIFDLKTEKKRFSLAGHRGGIQQLSFAPEGKSLLSYGYDHTLRRWDVVSGKEIGPIVGHQHEVTGVAFIQAGKQIVSTSQDGTVRFWDPFTGHEEKRWTAQGEFIDSITLHRDGKLMAIASSNDPRGWFRDYDAKQRRDRIRFYDLEKGTAISKWEVAGASWQTIAFSADGTSLFRSTPGMLAEHRLDNGSARVLLKIPADRRYVHVSQSPAGSELLVHVRTDAWGADDIHLRHLGETQDYFSRTGFSHTFHTATFAPDGKALAIGGNFQDESQRGPHYHLQLLSVADGRVLRTFTEAKREIYMIRFSPDGRLIAAVTMLGVSIFERHTGYEVDRLSGHEGAIHEMAFSPDGRLLVTASEDTTALVWDLTLILEKGRLPQLPAMEKELLRRWELIADDHPEKGRLALWELIATGEATVRFLSDRLDLTEAEELQRIPGLIADLDSELFQVRDKAMRNLEKIGCSARPDLERLRKNAKSAEARDRAERLLRRLDAEEDAATQAAVRRAIRVVEILERIPGKDSRQALEKIARWGRFNLQSLQAREVLVRLRG